MIDWHLALRPSVVYRGKLVVAFTLISMTRPWGAATNPRCHPTRASAPQGKKNCTDWVRQACFLQVRGATGKAVLSNCVFTACCAAGPADPRARRQRR